ncbi:MAG: hypothetical protein H7256_11985, partial [Bdellovibrio sp.]|nr:hypothetical protein [Bdellovibrio sp.]
MGRSHNFKLIIMFSLQLLWFSTAMAVPKTVTLQVKIMKPDTTALEAPSVGFQITTLDPAGVCVLYVETFGGISMTSSGGITNLNLGGGIQTYSAAGASYSDIFNNLATALPCQSGGNYVPTILDKRKIVIQFNDASASGWQTLPSVEINSVPFSNFAGDSVKLAGRPYTDFTLKTGFPDCNTAGKVLTYNGTSFSCVSPSAGSGTVTNVTSANSYLTIASGTTAPVITAVVGTSANTLAAGDDTRIVGAAQKSNNLSDLTSASTARTNLGLGTAAVLAAGTAANNLVQLDGSAKISAALLPASSVSTSTALVGDVTGTIGATVVSTVGTKTAAQIAQSVVDTLAATNANTASTIVKRDGSGNIATTSISATSLSTQNIYLYDNTNTNKILLKAPTTGITDYTLTLPPIKGTGNQILGYDNAGAVLENKSITAGTGVTITHSAGGIQIASSGGAGSVTSVTSANTDIGVATSTSTPVLTLNSGMGINQIVKFDGSARYPANDGSLITSLTPANLSAAVPINKGGTNATTAVAALNNLLPTQTSNSGKVLQTDGTNASWVLG